MDLATLTNQPRPLTVDDRTYQVYPLTLADLGALQKWVNEQFPDPLDALRGRLDGFSPEHQKFLLKDAAEASRRPRPRIGTPEADELLTTADGLAECLYLAVRRGDGAFSREQAAAICARLAPADIGAVFGAAFGTGPEDADPKAATSPPTGGASVTGS
jgi:hypothetical protein